MSDERLPILFLWHHHQPFYQAPGMKWPVMPWVRLHAARGYHDMITAATETGAQVTFNFSPSLLEQLVTAGLSSPTDEFERISRKPVPELSEPEKRFMLTHFFAINWAVHVRPNARYQTLLSKRGDKATDAALRQALVDFTAQDFADLNALFNLSWMGFAARRDPRIHELRAKGHDYTHGDVSAILGIQHDILERVLDLYREAYQNHQIDLSVSPFSHAILPLLCDTRVAAPDIPRQQLPKPDYQNPGDAERQLRLALKSFGEVWGRDPQGLWPSEGSVSEASLDLAARVGFRWAATDQSILERSERVGRDQLAHFAPYIWQSGERSIRVYFRDRALSDAIGFRYSTMSETQAVDDFVGHLERIDEATRGQAGRCVLVALDGENPWESYADGGEGFLYGVYRRLTKHRRLTLQTVSEHQMAGSRERIARLHAGSWIDANFRIWIGDPQKNQAWVELVRARRLLDELSAGDPHRDDCWTWLLRAQCSDWMWWYGEPFTSEYDGHYDELFRAHLKAVYSSAGRSPSPSLDLPISTLPRPERRRQPMFSISPVIDGRETSYYEWTGACRIDSRQYGAAMGRSERALRFLFYGFSEHELVFRFDPTTIQHPHAETRLVLHVVGRNQLSITVALDGTPRKAADDRTRWAVDELLEIAVARAEIGLSRGVECQFWVEIFEAGVVVEQLPPVGVYRFTVPTEETLAANWMV